MSLRAANATIKGYYYQFNLSILKILNLQNDEDFIIVEGIEDIDVNVASEKEAIQCKYLSAKKVTNSIIREPIILMIDHFLLSSERINYTLYAYFEEENNDIYSIDLKLLKEILVFKEYGKNIIYYELKSITDEMLSEFLSQFKFILGKEFNIQHNEIIKKLENKFQCTTFEADFHFYNNALRIILDKAISKPESDRKISKKDFFSKIDSRTILFNIWYQKLRTTKEYISQIRQQLASINALTPLKSKFIILDENILSHKEASYTSLAFIEDLINKYYKLGKALTDAKPLTLVLDCSLEKIKEIKILLIKNNIPFNDGYESIKFSPAFFNNKPLINVTESRSKISKSSYLIKIISKQTFIENFYELDLPKIIINFSKSEMTLNSDQYQLINVLYLESLQQAYELLS